MFWSPDQDLIQCFFLGKKEGRTRLALPFACLLFGLPCGLCVPLQNWAVCSKVLWTEETCCQGLRSLGLCGCVVPPLFWPQLDGFLFVSEEDQDEPVICSRWRCLMQDCFVACCFCCFVSCSLFVALCLLCHLAEIASHFVLLAAVCCLLYCFVTCCIVCSLIVAHGCVADCCSCVAPVD